MIMALLMEEGLALEMNTIKEFVAEAQAYKNSVKTVGHYVWQSYVAPKQADKVVQKELAQSAVAPLKPQMAIPAVLEVP